MLLGTLLLAGFSIASQAEGLYVICHPSVSLTESELRDVFLGEKQFAGSIRLAPADNSAAREAFLQVVLKMDSSKYLTLWVKKSFREAVNQPLPTANNAEALAYVRRARGGCSYINAAPGPGVLVVAIY